MLQDLVKLQKCLQRLWVSGIHYSLLSRRLLMPLMPFGLRGWAVLLQGRCAAIVIG
jgi:hypothetical protein